MTVVSAPAGTAPAPFANGYIYDSSKSFSVRADPASGVASVVFKLDGNQLRVESTVPYATAGDNKGVYTAWKPTSGNHTMIATPFSGTGGQGTAGSPVTVSFAVGSSSTPTPTPSVTPKPTATPIPTVTPSPTITPTPTPTPTPAPTPSGPKVIRLDGSDAPGGAVVAPFTSGYAYRSNGSLSIRLEPLSGVGSVTFKLDGKVLRTESTPPYSVAGDNSGVYTAWKPTTGSHMLVATPYSLSGAKGIAGMPVTVGFTATP